MTLEAVRPTQRDVTLDLYLVRNDPAYLTELEQQAADLPQVRFRVSAGIDFETRPTAGA